MPGLILAVLARLRFRTLFLVTAAIFWIDLLIPDLILFADELLLGALSLLLAALKRKPHANSEDWSPTSSNTADR